MTSILFHTTGVVPSNFSYSLSSFGAYLEFMSSLISTSSWIYIRKNLSFTLKDEEYESKDETYTVSTNFERNFLT